MANEENQQTELLKTLPGDDVRQIMWRYSDRFDLQMIVQSSRSVARGIVARLVADGARQSHVWTEQKNQLLEAFDQAGITSLFMEPKHGGYIEGPKNLAMALSAFELAWVDGGAATCSLATNLALAPIHEKGTEEQKNLYMSRCVPPQPGEDRKISRGAFALTEPLPYIGVDTGIVGGRVRVAEWKKGEEPILQIEKRGRFITNIEFANFITAAVTSNDERIKGSCMVILEEDDPGTFDRGAPTLKLVHQLSSTGDPIFSLRIPANRIIGGYTIQDGVIVPNYSHNQIIESVFLRTRVTPAVMTAAKLISAVEPIIRYQRGRFQGGDAAQPGSLRFELGLQQKEDSLLRLVDVWAGGEAATSLGLATARELDDFEPIEAEKEAYFAEQGIKGPRAQMKALKEANKLALELLQLRRKGGKESKARIASLESMNLVQYVLRDSLANVLCPACKLWNTGQGTNYMREAVSLMGGYGITEDCPGFLPYKWMDAQLEATYEGPEAVQRRHLTASMTNEVFLEQINNWITELRAVASERPGSGACALATAFQLWRWTLNHLADAKDAFGKPLYHSKRQGVTFPLADALCWLLAARYQILDTIELEEKGPLSPTLSEGLVGYVSFFTDLCHVQSCRAAGEASRVCAELVFGYNRHPSWDLEGKQCYTEDQANALESTIPGICDCSSGMGNVLDASGCHATKAGPCVRFDGLDSFTRLRGKLDGCLTGCRLAKDRAAMALAQVMIPEALDYPQ